MKYASYLIVANSLPPSSIVKEIAQNKIIVALDGVACNLAKVGIKPDIIIGDFDSVEENEQYKYIWGIKQGFNELQEKSNSVFDEPYIGNFNITIVPAKNQQYTDLQKAIKFIKQHVTQYTHYPLAHDIHILSSPGLRIDHELSSIFTLKSEYNKTCPIYMHREYQTIEYVTNVDVIMRGKSLDYCGVFGFPDATMSVKNAALEYGDIHPFTLSLTRHSSSNRMMDNEAKVGIQGQALIVHPPMYPSQRTFFQKNRTAQLSELLEDMKKKLYIGTACDCYHALNHIENIHGITCVTHPLQKLGTFNKDELILMSIPDDAYELFMAALPA